MKALIEAELFKQLMYSRKPRSLRQIEAHGIDALVIRPAAPEDTGGLRRLALLDCASVPTGPVLVAEREGVLIAALPLEKKAKAIADPFAPTADAVCLLEVRRAQLRAAA